MKYFRRIPRLLIFGEFVYERKFVFIDSRLTYLSDNDDKSSLWKKSPNNSLSQHYNYCNKFNDTVALQKCLKKNYL